MVMSAIVAIILLVTGVALLFMDVPSTIENMAVVLIVVACIKLIVLASNCNWRERCQVSVIRIRRVAAEPIYGHNSQERGRWTDPVPEEESPANQSLHPTAAESLWFGHHTVKKGRRG